MVREQIRANSLKIFVFVVGGGDGGFHADVVDGVVGVVASAAVVIVVSIVVGVGIASGVVGVVVGGA
eukprot:451598-Pyramimonas_sp.AAC.1